MPQVPRLAPPPVCGGMLISSIGKTHTAQSLDTLVVTSDQEPKGSLDDPKVEQRVTHSHTMQLHAHPQ